MNAAPGSWIACRATGPDDLDRMVYVLVGDGECNAGSVWEAFMAAGNYRLDNLAFLIDANKSQAKGSVNLEMSIAPLSDKLAAFNLDVSVAAVGTDPEDFIHTGHVNDLPHRYGMTSDRVVERAAALLERPRRS